MSPDDSNQTIYHRHGESIISLWQPQPLPDMFPYPKVEFFSTYISRGQPVNNELSGFMISVFSLGCGPVL